MKQHINITGMTCGNCQKSVTQKLAAMPGVDAVAVDLSTGAASFESDAPVPLTTIAQQLGAKYTVTAAEEASPSTAKWQQLRPLFLIFGYLFVSTFLLTFGQGATAFMRVFMGMFYLVFAFFKFLDYSGFPASFAMYDPIARRFSFYGWLYPFLETALGLCFLYAWAMPYALGITGFVLGATTWGVIQQLRKKTTIQCACLGTALKLPMTEATLIENSLMLLMALGMGVQLL